jgi:integrase/recombinase XerD
MIVQVEAFLSSLESGSGYSKSTRQAYSSDLSRFMGYLWETLERRPVIDDFNITLIAGFIEYEQILEMKPSTLNRRQATLKRFANFLIENCLIDINPVAEIQSMAGGIKVNPGQKAKIKYLTPFEIDLLKMTMKATQNSRAVRDLVIFELLLETGRSITDLVGLDLSDIDLRAKSVRFSKSDSNDAWLTIQNSVSGLNRYLEEGRPELSQSLNEPALFVSQLGGRISRQGIWQVFRKWGILAGLVKELTPRLIRHTAVNNMVSSGHSLTEIQRKLGHRNLLSTKALVRRLKSIE